MTASRLFVLVAAFVALVYLIPLAPQPLVDYLIDEDGLVENVGTLGFFTAGLCFAIGFVRSGRPELDYGRVKRLSLALLALILFVGVGEEISWGQRILGFDTPPVLGARNAQQEVNLHNLDFFHRRLWSVDRLFVVFWSVLLLGIPLLAKTSESLGSRLKRVVPVFPIALGLLFLLNYAMANIVRPFVERSGAYHGTLLSAKGAVTEVKEGVYGVLFALVGVYLLRVMIRRQAVGSRL